MKARVFPPAFALSAVVATLTLHAGDWPQWRGPNRDGKAQGEKALTTLPASAKPLWAIPIGKGQGGAVISNGKLAVVHEVEKDGKKLEAALLLDAANGKTIWEKTFAESWQFGNEYGPGPRCSAMVDGDLVFVQGAKGVLACLQLSDGKILWSADYDKDWGAKWLGGNLPGSKGTGATRHGNNGPPVADDKHIYAPVGSPTGASLVAFEKRTGKMVWKSGTDFAAYAALMLGELGGVKQVVMASAAALSGFRASDGKQLWSVPLKTDAARNIVTPILQGDTVTAASFSVGAFQLRIRNTGDGQETDQVWATRDVRTNMSTPVQQGAQFYGLGTGTQATTFVCVDAATGKQRWSQPGFPENASIINLGGQLLVHTSPGELVLVQVNPEKYVEQGRMQVSGRTWHFPAYANGVLYVKDNRQLAAIRLAP